MAPMANSLYPDPGLAGDMPLAMGFSRIVACVGSSDPASKVILHAVIVAKALSVPLLLLRVCETRTARGECLDPVDWEIRRREAFTRVAALVDGHRRHYVDIEAQVLEGQAAEQISQWSQQHPNDLMVLGTHGTWRPSSKGLGDTVREVIDRAAGSLLLVPESAVEAPLMGYRRVLVPIDGSCRAESVLPLAIHLAQSQGAELLLVHVVPPSFLTEVGPAESEDLELCERLVRRNERVARLYLERLQSRASEKGIAVRIQVLREDVRSSLVRTATDEAVDLVVLSAQGCSGRLDVPYGSVTSFLMTHTSQPLLIMRPQALCNGLDAGRGSTVELRYRLPGAW